MKVFNKIFGLALVTLIMTACGSSTPVTQPVTATNGGGYYNQNGQWVQTGQPGQPGYPVQGQGGCVPLQSQLSFTANGAQMSSTSILAGSFPAQSGLGSYGQVVMGGGGFNGAQGSIQYQPKQGQSGMLQLFAGSTSGQGSVTGTISLSPYLIQQIQSMSGGNTQYGNYGNYNNPTAQNGACVNSIALWAVQTLSGQPSYGGQTGYNAPQTGYINQAVVYLHMSNGQTIGPLAF